LFVKDAALITPPNVGEWGKKRGEATIASDISRILVGLPPDLLHQFEEVHNGTVKRRELRRKDGTVYLTDKDILVSNPERWHQSQRLRNGRVTQAGARDRNIGRSRAHVRGVVSTSVFRAYMRKAKRRVGILAGGWNAAAVALGLKLPDWIARHGKKHGWCRVNLGGDKMSISIRNAVQFGADVKGLHRRIQSALDRRAEQIEKQVANYELVRAARDAGL
jgi:hypothetical protein